MHEELEERERGRETKTEGKEYRETEGRDSLLWIPSVTPC